MIIKISDDTLIGKTDKEIAKIATDIFCGKMNVPGIEIYGEPPEDKEEPEKNYMFLNPEFKEELRQLINKHSIENDSQTPDWCIASYLINCLTAMNCVINGRDIWYEDDKKLTVTKLD